MVLLEVLRTMVELVVVATMVVAVWDMPMPVVAAVVLSQDMQA